MPVACSQPSYLLPEQTWMCPAPLLPLGQSLPASQRCSWTVLAASGPELGQALRCANSQLGMPDLAWGAACLGPWAILMKTESLKGPRVSAPNRPLMPGGFCACYTWSWGNPLKIYIESVAPKIREWTADWIFRCTPLFHTQCLIWDTPNSFSLSKIIRFSDITKSPPFQTSYPYILHETQQEGGHETVGSTSFNPSSNSTAQLVGPRSSHRSLKLWETYLKTMV